MRQVPKFFQDRSGSTAITVAIALPALLYGAGLAIEYGNAVRLKERMQAAADAGAIAAAGDLRLASTTQLTASSDAQTLVLSSLMGAPATPTVTVSFPALQTAKVTVDMDAPAVFGTIMGRRSSHIEVSATAKLSNSGTPTCIVILDPSANQALSMSGGTITAPGCSVLSNSTSSSGMSLSGASALTSGFTCSAGGVSGLGYTPSPVTDCPPTPDPLVAKAPPPIGSCTTQPTKIGSGTVQLFPGTFCGGLSVNGGAKVTLSPGIYIIKNGTLAITGPSVLQGTNVGIYLTGTNATFTFNGSSTINLSAPNSGPMAGMLIWEDRNNVALKQHSILSNNAHNLLGTIYLPQGILAVQSNTPLADKSAYTVVIARRLVLSNNPNLVMNINYSATDIPVPLGLGPTGKTSLIK